MFALHWLKDSSGSPVRSTPSKAQAAGLFGGEETLPALLFALLGVDHTG